MRPAEPVDKAHHDALGLAQRRDRIPQTGFDVGQFGEALQEHRWLLSRSCSALPNAEQIAHGIGHRGDVVPVLPRVRERFGRRVPAEERATRAHQGAPEPRLYSSHEALEILHYVNRPPTEVGALQRMSVRVLGIDVDDRTVDRWVSWLAPTVQPFFVESAADWPTVDAACVTPELSDTYALWRVKDGDVQIWLDETTFNDLPRQDRARLVRAQLRHRRGAVPTVRAWSDLIDPAVLRSQADGHRFVWWPSLVTGRAEAVLQRVVARSPTGRAKDGLTTRHRDVRAATWRACDERVPGARRLAGTFPPGSGPNCFGTVMGAAGVADADDECVVCEPFEDWLTAMCRRGGRDDLPGTVFVWRDKGSAAAHAAITLGDGWAFEKPSREWWTPRIVATVDDLLRANRAVGWRLERHRIAP